MSLRYYANAPATTLANLASNSDTSIVVTSSVGFPLSYPFTLILDRGQATEEVVDVTAGSGTTLTVTRGVDGTTAFDHTAGASVVAGFSARDLREANAHINATTGVHGLVGGPVGTTDVQTLTNKNLTSATNTFPTSLATLTGVQTLTNKTLAITSGNVISGFTASRIITSTAGGVLTSGPALPVGTLVGTSDVQTLTSKTLNVTQNPINGFAGVGAALVSGGALTGSVKLMPNGNVVGDTDTQGMSSKTFTSSIFSSSSNVMPVSVRCQVRRTASESHNGTPAAIVWTSTDYNVSFGISGSTVTVPFNGAYSISAIVGWDGVGGADRVGISIVVNGTTCVAVDQKDLSSSVDSLTTTSCGVPVIQLNAGDTVAVYAYTTAAGGVTTGSNTLVSSVPVLTVAWLGS